MKKTLFRWKIAIGLVILLMPSLASFAQDFFFIPDQNKSHNDRAIALGAGAIPPATGSQDDTGLEPNTNAGPFYTSTNVGVRSITTFNQAAFTTPLVATALDIQTSCVELSTFNGFQNSLNQGDNSIIQVVINKKAALTSNLDLRVKIYYFNAGTAMPTDHPTTPANLLMDAKLGTLTSFNGDLLPNTWTYGDASSNLNADFTALTDPVFAFKLVPTNSGGSTADFIVFRCRWQAPTTGDHYCLFAMIEEGGVSNGEASWTWADRTPDVAAKNNVAWRNLSIIDPNGGGSPEPPLPPKPKMHSINIGNPFETPEVMYFQWRPGATFDATQFAASFKLTLDFTGLPQSYWPNQDSVRLLNAGKRIEYDNTKGIMTLYAPDVSLPGIRFKPHEVFPLKISIDNTKPMAEGQYISYTSLFEQYWTDKKNKRIVLGGQEIAFNNYPPQVKGNGGGGQPAPDCTGIMCWITKWWFWLIILILLGLIVKALSRKKS